MTHFPTLDPELAAAVTMLPSLDFGDVASARSTFDSLLDAMLADLSMDGVSLRELTAPGLDGAPDVVVRFFTPEHVAGPLPVLVWM